MLSDIQIDRYSRQIILPEVGGRGQQKLLSSTLALLATDETSILPAYLAAAGVGRLVIWNPGAQTTSEALQDISDLNPDCALESRAEPVSRLNCESLIAESNPVAVVIMEEHAQAAELMNAACAATATPLVWGGTMGAKAYLTVFDPRQSPGCRACAVPFFESGGDSVLRRLANAALGGQLAAEAIKSVLGNSSSIAGRVLCLDVEAATVTSAAFAPNMVCAVCSRGSHV
jgi:adenylyltransferase/sulfurtransferase